MKIVVVEDEIRSREGLIHLLEKLDSRYEVAGWAENGEEGLKLIRKHDPNLVITDIRMPVLDGIGMLQEMKREKCRAKIILLSAFAEFSYAQQAISLGVDEYLLKPITVNGLMDALDKVSSKMEDEEGALKQAPTSRLVQQALKLIDSSEGIVLPLKGISQKLKVTPEYLSAQFYRETGSHFSQYVKMKRLERAKRLLRNTRVTIADIAVRCGYQDARYFSRMFKRCTGMLPVEYRRRES